jgi:hypothetical protein
LDAQMRLAMAAALTAFASAVLTSKL